MARGCFHSACHVVAWGLLCLGECARGGGRCPAGTAAQVSYQWDVQQTVERIVAELQGRGYAVWLDLLCMKGSIVDACAPKQPRLPRFVHLLMACLSPTG